MKAWVYVEGEADRLALESLWRGWETELKRVGHTIEVVALGKKSEFLNLIAGRAGRRLLDQPEDVVVGLPDLYPNRGFSGEFRHATFEELQDVQRAQVTKGLRSVFGQPPQKSERLLKRFLPSSLKCDLEMLLLAARNELCQYLGIARDAYYWRCPVEDQDQSHPPKHIIEELFDKSSLRGRYRPTRHASAVLGRARNMRRIIYNSRGQVQCPVFKRMLDWIGERTGIAAYQ